MHSIHDERWDWVTDTQQVSTHSDTASTYILLEKCNVCHLPFLTFITLGQVSTCNHHQFQLNIIQQL